MFIPKDLANSWTYMVLFYTGPGKDYHYFGGGYYHLSKEIAPRKNYTTPKKF